MRAVIQRVSNATVRVDNQILASIGRGLLAFVAAAPSDTDADIEWLASKILSQKLFNTEEGSWKADVVTIKGDLLLVSQFTLLASCKKGTRPSWHRAAPPEIARPLFDALCVRCQSLLGRTVFTGMFGSHMEISLVNEGPVTILLDSATKE